MERATTIETGLKVNGKHNERETRLTPVNMNGQRLPEDRCRQEQGADPRKSGKLSGTRVDSKGTSRTARQGYRDGNRGPEKLYIVGPNTGESGELWKRYPHDRRRRGREVDDREVMEDGGKCMKSNSMMTS